MKRFIVGMAIAALASVFSTPALAQAYPSKPIQVIVGYGAGGVTDAITRISAEAMSKRLGQSIVVENRTGANGLIAAVAVKRATPDGYTLYGGSVTPFSPVFMKENMIASKELQPVSIMALSDWFLYVRGDLGVSSLKDLAQYSKAHPGQLRFASPSPANEALVALLGKRVGFEFQTIPYKTTDQTIASMLANDTQITFNGFAGFGSHLQSGQIRAIATLSATRSGLSPATATTAEQGIPIEMRTNLALWAPPNTPREIVLKLQQTLAEALKDPAVVSKLSNIGMLPGGTSPEELVKTVDGEMQIYTEAAKLVGLQPQ